MATCIVYIRSTVAQDFDCLGHIQVHDMIVHACSDVLAAVAHEQDALGWQDEHENDAGMVRVAATHAQNCMNMEADAQDLSSPKS